MKTATRKTPATQTVRSSPSGGLGDRLETTVRATFRRMENDPFFRRFLNGHLAREEYAYFLVQTYHYVMITPETYRWALETMRRRPQSHYDLFGVEFEEHWKEELGHEHWIQEDLQSLGYNAEALVRQIAPNPAIEAYVALSRFAMQGAAPLALLGQDYFLENLALTYGERILRGLAYASDPRMRDACRFVQRHGEADIHHMELNRNALARIRDVNEADEIVRMADATGWFYSSIPQYYEAKLIHG